MADATVTHDPSYVSYLADKLEAMLTLLHNDAMSERILALTADQRVSAIAACLDVASEVAEAARVTAAD